MDVKGSHPAKATSPFRGRGRCCHVVHLNTAGLAGVRGDTPGEAIMDDRQLWTGAAVGPVPVADLIFPPAIIFPRKPAKRRCCFCLTIGRDVRSLMKER